MSLNYKILSIITLFIYLYNLIVIRVEKEDLNPIFHNKQEYYANELQEFWLGVVVVAFLFLFIFMWKQTHIGKRECVCLFLKFKGREEEKKVVVPHYLNEYVMYNIT